MGQGGYLKDFVGSELISAMCLYLYLYPMEIDIAKMKRTMERRGESGVHMILKRVRAQYNTLHPPVH